MTEFMMIFRNDYNPSFKPTPEQMQASVKQWQDWMGGIAAQGKFVGTTRLSSEGSKILKPNHVIADGPYIEMKEIVGGSLNVKASSMEEALKLAEGCPILQIGGNVEVRKVIPMNN
ncbi:MAG: transcription initiation protein [Bacteroidia bacterium]|nr:transcription initiation protein [Bacteroidia bacterium]